MEVFMHNLPLHLEEDDVKLSLASLLHGPDFDFVKTNFAVHLHRQRPGARSRTGTFTLADTATAQKFLALYESGNAHFDGRVVYFKPSNHPARQEVVELISRMPWINPVEEREQRKRDEFLTESSASVSAIQFGWHCRDGVFSIEAQATQDAEICFNPQRRELHVVVQHDISIQDIIAIRQSSIHSISNHFSTFDEKYVLFLELGMPPLFLRKNIASDIQTLFSDISIFPSLDVQTPFSRMSTFPLLDNPRAVSYASLVLRLVFTSKKESERFSRLSEAAGLRHIQTYEAMIERRGLFSAARLDLLEWNLRKFNWCVAFQLASLLQNLVLDTAELLGLLPRIREIVRVHGRTYTAKFLKEFRNQASALWYSDDPSESILSCFESTEREFAKHGDTLSLVPDDGSYYQSLHVIITPTTMFLNGPYPEQSNRVIRRYDVGHQENFLRVTFRDENHLQYRVDRDIDGPGFIKARFGEFLKNGLSIAGRVFDFLAYSQSALKEHSVW